MLLSTLAHRSPNQWALSFHLSQSIWLRDKKGLWLFPAKVLSVFNYIERHNITSHSLKMLNKMTSPSSQKSFVYSSADMDWKSRNRHLRNDFWPRSNAWQTVWLQQWMFHGTPGRINIHLRTTLFEKMVSLHIMRRETASFRRLVGWSAAWKKTTERNRGKRGPLRYSPRTEHLEQARWEEKYGGKTKLSFRITYTFSTLLSFAIPSNLVDRRTW